MKLNPELRARLAERCPNFREQLEGVARHANGDAIEFAQLVVQYGYVDRDTAGEIIAAEMGRTYVNLGTTLFQDEILIKVPVEFAKANGVMPLYKFGEAITVAMADPCDAKILGALELFLAGPVSPVFSFPDEIESAVLVKYQSPV